VSGFIAVSTVLVLVGFARAIDLVETATSPFIVHFNDTQGITTANGAGIIVFAGIFGIAVIALNGSLALEFKERNAFFGRLIAVVTLIFAALLFIAFTAILSVN